MTLNTIDSVYEVNILNQYVSINTTPNTYDKNGNLACDGTFTYIYDCENRLIEVHQGENTIATYKYDFAGRRVSKADYTLSPARYTLFCYDGDNIIADYNEAGTLQRRYYFGPGIDEPICMMKGLSTYYYHLDGLGSIIAISNSSGQVQETYSYDVFGKPTIKGPYGDVRSSSLYGNPYMFTGREYDSETGNYYYHARYYNPLIGRFMSPDPVAQFIQLATSSKLSKYDFPSAYLSSKSINKFLQDEPLGKFLQINGIGRFLKTYKSGFIPELNLYRYCENDPVIYTDPYGLGIWAWIGGVFEAAGGGLVSYAAIVGFATAPAWVVPVGVGLIAFGVGNQIGDEIFGPEKTPGKRDTQRRADEYNRGCDEYPTSGGD